MKNKTEFDKQALLYAQYRPNYPNELYKYLAQICAKNSVALDVGTGSGQCAVDLARYFETVHASDMSHEQIANAITNPKVHYFCAPAHETNLENESVDLITVATAIHWFDLDLFFAEAKRIMHKDSILAFWAYGWHQCENHEITKVFNEIGKIELKDYWSEQPKLIWSEYKTISFPFNEMKAPVFYIDTKWNLNEFIGYLSTWSATQKYIDRHKHHPAQNFMNRLQKAWGDPNNKLNFKSPLHLRHGKKIL